MVWDNVLSKKMYLKSELTLSAKLYNMKKQQSSISVQAVPMHREWGSLCVWKCALWYSDTSDNIFHKKHITNLEYLRENKKKWNYGHSQIFLHCQNIISIQ